MHKFNWQRYIKMKAIYFHVYCLVFGLLIGILSMFHFRENLSPIYENCVEMEENDTDDNYDGQYIDVDKYHKADHTHNKEFDDEKFIQRKGSALVNNLDIILHDQIEAKELARKVKILCWVLTFPGAIHSRATAVRDTWGKRCNMIVFMSTEPLDDPFPVVGLDAPEGYRNLWHKTQAAWKYIRENHIRDADWFIKIDDDAFLIAENLRFFLKDYDTEDAHFFGRQFDHNFNSGGASYVFSRKTLKEFVKVIKNKDLCKTVTEAEDRQVGICLKAANIYAEDTRDNSQRQRFHPFVPSEELSGNVPKWVYDNEKWEVKTGFECCSNYSISFHYISPQRMKEMYFLIYEHNAYGT